MPDDGHTDIPLKGWLWELSDRLHKIALGIQQVWMDLSLGLWSVSVAVWTNLQSGVAPLFMESGLFSYFSHLHLGFFSYSAHMVLKRNAISSWLLTVIPGNSCLSWSEARSVCLHVTSSLGAPEWLIAHLVLPSLPSSGKDPLELHHQHQYLHPKA
jgi:hypothetical protein